jgi:hypothetical protein
MTSAWLTLPGARANGIATVLLDRLRLNGPDLNAIRDLSKSVIRHARDDAPGGSKCTARSKPHEAS